MNRERSTPCPSVPRPILRNGTGRQHSCGRHLLRRFDLRELSGLDADLGLLLLQLAVADEVVAQVQQSRRRTVIIP